MDMGHWVEPQVLGNAQKGYGEPVVTLPTHSQYIHSPPPGQAPPGVHHYVNRPGQLQGMGAAPSTMKNLLPGIVIGVLGVIFLGPFLGASVAGSLGMKPKRNPRRRRRRRKKK